MPQDDEPHVIVAGCRHGGLAVMRALGPLGFRITALTDDDAGFGARSRFVSEVSRGPDPADVDAFAAHLLDNADRWAGALVLDTDDRYTEALARRRDELTPMFHLVAPPWEIARWFLEKDRTAQLARSLGVPHPSVHRASTLEELDGLAGGVRLPAMVKPIRSHEFVAAFGAKLWVVEDWESLRQAFARAIDQGVEVIVQEVIPGSDEGTLESIELYVNRDGTLGAHQCNVKVRQSPPGFGVMRVGRSVPVIEDIRDHALALLDHVDFRGYASAEFKRDPRDGLPKLIEVNVRLPRNGALMTRSGTNFPLEIHRDLVCCAPSRERPFRSAWFIDLAADVIDTLRGDRTVLRRPWSAVRPYLARRRAFAVLSARDPAPALAWSGVKVRKLLRGVRRERTSGGHRQE